MRRACCSALLIAALVAAAGCASRARPPRSVEPPQRATSPPRPAAIPPRSASAFPDCDPRWRDPDRTRVALGLLAADCADERGRNAVYVTRLVGVQGAPSPAQRAGVKPGDRIVKVDACEVASTHDLARQLSYAPEGWVARLALDRAGKALDLFVPTVPFPERIEPKGAPRLITEGCKAIGRPPAS